MGVVLSGHHVYKQCLETVFALDPSGVGVEIEACRRVSGARLADSFQQLPKIALYKPDVDDASLYLLDYYRF